jgi:hypothetical protein
MNLKMRIAGSGHFLVAAFLMLVPMRMAAESLDARAAVDAVLRDNLHGLELDARCVELAAFALALSAWRYPDEYGEPLGYRDLPKLNVACCGLAVTGQEADWLALAGDDEHLQRGMKALYDAFQDAPLLGSLIDPQRAAKGDLITADFSELAPLLTEALAQETPHIDTEEGAELSETVIAAQGLAEAARLLGQRYHLVVTNVPYLGRSKQDPFLRKYIEQHFSEGKADLASVFIMRCLALCASEGILSLVAPQNWWFLSSYTNLRKTLLNSKCFCLLASLGEESWQSFGDRGPLATLMIFGNSLPKTNSSSSCINALPPPTIELKQQELKSGALLQIKQVSFYKNPDARIILNESFDTKLLAEYASGLQGVSTSDTPRFKLNFWELFLISNGWRWFQSAPEQTIHYGGCEYIVWMRLLFEIYEEARQDCIGSSDFEETRAASKESGIYLRGQAAWSQKGIAIRQMRDLPATLTQATPFDTSAAVILPKNPQYLAAIWCFCSSPIYLDTVRKVDRKLNVTNSTLVKVPFDLEYWQQVAAERYPNGLPKPYSDDPTQWLFHGHPKPATDPLQVAVARLLGYTWPAETDADMELSDEARAWIAQSAQLSPHADDDGIVCLPPLRGEKSAAERLLNLLIDAWETVEPGSWKGTVLDKLLAEADCAGKSLEVWLRDKFFEQHCKRFHHRPFIWHVWDGQKDGFSALVNYHKLDAKNLERLIHTYLGDWIRTQEQGVKDHLDGAVTRLAAAKNLQQRLALILEGEAPHDIFVRWKALSEQPIGWNPDLNDGVRLNIRPFMTAEVLRHNKPPKLNIKWDKDRGKDVASAPWFPVFNGDRINDHHLTLAEKVSAQSKTP